MVKPVGGRYHRNELGFVGAPCGTIMNLMNQLKYKLEDYSIGLMDADHGDKSPDLLYNSIYTDKIGYHQISYNDNHIDYSLKRHFQFCDLVFVNSNHFKADKQIVIVNAKKEDSLKRKLDRLTNVKAIVLDEGIEEPFDFLKSELNNYSGIPIFKISEEAALASLVQELIEGDLPRLKGLLLYGGKSSRMGRDKGQIQYHGIPHVDYLSDLLTKYCEEVFISVAKDDSELNYPTIVDSFTGLGPFGGILSAFRKDPNFAYLTMPCDVPFVDDSLLGQLIENRDSSKVATCFHNEETGFPEPLITIWEPKAYPQLLHFLSQGYSCPRKVLINSDINEIMPDSQHSLFNANNPEEMKYAQGQLST